MILSNTMVGKGGRRTAQWPAGVATMVRLMILVAVSMGVLAALLVVTGHDAPQALRAMVRGAAGNWYQFSSVTIVRAVPLMFAGAAVAVAFRAGILNIGAEGQLLAGAAAAAALASITSSVTAGIPAALVVLLMLAVGAFAGAFTAAIAAVLRHRFGVQEVISTIMLNFVALNVVGYLVRGPLQEPLRIYPQSPSLPAALQLPVLWPGSRLHIGVLIAIGVTVALWYWITRMAGGFRVRAVGLNAAAAQSAGRIDVGKVGTQVFLLSGVLAGLGGAVEYAGTTYALYENFSPGYGYTAIAVALLARLNLLAVVFTAILFGAIDAGAGAMQRDAGVPNVVVSVIVATLIVLVVLGDRLERRQTTLEQGT